jgi:RNA polymerase sigma-70 factor (ECF subfamily)
MERLRDRLLVKRILSGDETAGERLVAEHYARICRFLSHLTGSLENAEHLTQQTFVNAWRALAAFKGESSLATWLHRIAYHAYTHHRRSRREHAPLDAVAVPDGAAAGELEAVLVRDALTQLSPEHREAFLLYHVQGFCVAEVAAVLDVPAGTVKSRLFAARRRLRELLSEPQEVATDEMPAAQPECETSR